MHAPLLGTIVALCLLPAGMHAMQVVAVVVTVVVAMSIRMEKLPSLAAYR